MTRDTIFGLSKYLGASLWMILRSRNPKGPTYDPTVIGTIPMRFMKVGMAANID